MNTSNVGMDSSYVPHPTEGEDVDMQDVFESEGDAHSKELDMPGENTNAVEGWDDQDYYEYEDDNEDGSSEFDEPIDNLTETSTAALLSNILAQLSRASLVVQQSEPEPAPTVDASGNGSAGSELHAALDSRAPDQEGDMASSRQNGSETDTGMDLGGTAWEEDVALDNSTLYDRSRQLL
ncbi:hypothetical protein DXG01_011042 [Tephrocybe rancida]|nr:hypothetical protein DXG01_011042 [Tephrocybe rancida]